MHAAALGCQAIGVGARFPRALCRMRFEQCDVDHPTAEEGAPPEVVGARVRYVLI